MASILKERRLPTVKRGRRWKKEGDWRGQKKGGGITVTVRKEKTLVEA